MTRSILFRVVAAIVLVAALIGLGSYVYQAGVMQGMAGTAQLKPGEGVPLLPYHGMPYGGHFFGFGFFAMLMPLFFIFVIFWMLRAVFFGYMPHHHHGWRWGYRDWESMHKMAGNGECYGGVPPFFEEWHRKAHEGHPSAGTEDKEA